MSPIKNITPAENFAGHISVQDCWQALCDASCAYLIDVRSRPEWVFVGTPEISATPASLISIELQQFNPADNKMSENKNFVREVEEAVKEKDAYLFFICRSGVRSQTAAAIMTQAGYKNSFNVADGFEGGVDACGHRGTKNGWKAAGLDWIQK